MSTDIARRDTDSWVDVLPAVGDLATKIAGTEFVPAGLAGKPAAVAAAILYGREVGLGPMQSLQSISVIKGKPTLSAEAMRAMVLADGHSIRFVEMTNTRCVVEGRRRGDDEPTRVAFSMDDAKRMGLSGQQQYQKMPRQMLAARATTELCRLVFADVIGGLLGDVEADDLEPAVPAPAVEIATVKRTARRAAKPAPVVDTPPLDDVDTTTGEIVEAEIVDDVPHGSDTDAPPLDDEGAMTDEPGATPAQLRAMGAAFTAIGWTDRADRLRATSVIVGRDVGSAKELTHVEAGALLDTLTMAQRSDDPNGYLLALFEAVADAD